MRLKHLQTLRAPLLHDGATPLLQSCFLGCITSVFYAL